MWDARAVIVGILAAAVGAVCVLAVISVAWWGRPLSEIGGDVLIAILGAVVAIIASYVGRYSGPAPDEPPPPPDEDEPP